MERVEVTNPMISLCYMQVCAADDATDEEILNVCNSKNPSGTRNGWSGVVRKGNQYNVPDNGLPGPCAEHKGRTHFIIVC